MSLIEFVVFGFVAAVLVWRLYSLLGTDDGARFPEEAEGPASPAASSSLSSPAPGAPLPFAAVPEGRELSVLERIARADADFSEASFLEGARRAFEMIVVSFAKGALEDIRGFVSKELFQRFSGVVADREAARQTMELEIISFKETKIVGSSLTGSEATLAVQFTTEQTNVLRAEGGEVLEGSPTFVDTITDTWTFMRKLTANDKTRGWTLIATRTA